MIQTRVNPWTRDGINLHCRGKNQAQALPPLEASTYYWGQGAVIGPGTSADRRRHWMNGVAHHLVNKSDDTDESVTTKVLFTTRYQEREG